MKTRTNLISKKSLIKATSGIMSLVLTANIGLSLLDKNVFAGEVSITNGVVTLTSSFGDTDSEFHLANGGISYSRDNQDFNEPVSDNASFTIKNSTLYVDSDYVFNSITLNNSTLYINGCSVEWVSISGSGTAKITNCGTLNTDGFSASILANNGIRYFQNGEGTTPGTIIGRSVSINNDIYSDVSGSVIEAQNAFRKDTRDINATVDVGSLTTIESEGGTFTLSVYGATKVISGEVADGTDAYTLFDSPEVALSGIPSVIYYGQEYNISDYVSVAEGYDESLITYEYSSNGGLNVMEGKPSYPGNYSVRAKAPSYGSFLEKNTGWTSYNIRFLPTDALEEFYNEGDPYVTVTGVTTGSDNKMYVGEGITLTAPEGVLLQFPSAGREALHTPAQSVTLTHDDLFLEGYTTINQDFDIQFVRERDSATTEYKSILEVVDGIEDYIFDNNDPVIKGYSVEDSTFTSISLESDKVVANVLQISISDDNLSEVTIYINGSSTDYSDKIKDDGTFSLNIESEAGKSIPIRVIAKDTSGRETVVEFELFHEPVDPTFNVSFPSTFYIGDDFSSQISVDTNSDGEIWFTYNGSMIQPTEVGYYELRISVSATDFYNFTDYSRIIKVVNKLTGVTVTVDDINVGGTVSPSLSGVPEDYEGTDDIEYWYMPEGEDVEFTEDVPTEAGTYVVMVVFPETDTYAGTECTATFTISKNIVEGTVEVADSYVGETVTPKVTTVSDGKDSATFEYKLKSEEDDSYSATVPTAAGEYTVRATIPETDKYGKIVCYDDFTISKITCTVEITVKRTYVGVAPSVEISTLSDGKNNAIFEYKISGDSDETYTEVIPSADGIYVLRVTIPETDKYLSCSDTCEIYVDSRPSLKVSVDDIYYGENPDPKITINSIVSGRTEKPKYKLISAPDSAYSETVPTAIGEYKVCVSTYFSSYDLTITTYDTFSIMKAPVEATVSVPDTFVNGPVEPEINVATINYNGNIDNAVIEYKLSTAEDDAYSTTVPTAAGTYTVRATLPSTSTYEGTVCENTFTINKHVPRASIEASNIYVGDSPDITLTGNIMTRTDLIYEYKSVSASGSSYSLDEPATAGNYNVRVTAPETDYYEEAVFTSTFTVSKRPCAVNVTAYEIYAGDEPNLDIETNSDGLDLATYEFREYSESVFKEGYPNEAGYYVIKVTIPETDKYLEGSGTCEMQVNRNEVTATITVANIYVGETPNPVITSESPAKNQATIEYKLKSEPESAYSATVPTAAGEYSVRASIPFTTFYKAVTCESTFTIMKKDISATVSVADIIYGETITPVVTLNSEDYEGMDQVYYVYAPYDPENPQEFTEDVPTEVGDYAVMAVFPATYTYNRTVIFANFSINKVPASVTVSVEDYYVGETMHRDFELTNKKTNSQYFFPFNEYIYYEYKPFDAPDTEYSETVPTAAGTYTIRLTVLPNKYCEDGTATDTFTIKKHVTTAAVSVDDIYVGGTISPVVTTNSDGKADTVIEYKLTTATESAFTTTVPTAAGTYVVRITVPETPVYTSATASDSFTISKISAVAEVSVADIYVGGTVSPVITTESDGKADTVFVYKVADADDTEYSETIPTAAGTYSVRATVPETFAYTGATAYATFTINKNSATAEVSVANITVGNKPEPVVTTVSDGKADATFEYKAADADDSEYSDTIPTAAGTYSVRATVPATAEYLGITCTSEFTISLNKVTVMDLTVEDIYYGQTVTPSFKTDSDGSVTIMYKLTVAPDSAYSTTVPTVTGKYTARATVSETDTYEGAVCYKEFSISYLEAPQVAYNPTGKSGNEGYFTSDVQLAAPEGYTISATTDGEYSKSIPYTEGMDKIYLKRDDGALTSAITITNKPMIDKSAPAITTSTGLIADGSVMYASDMSITISDTNLKSLKVNDEVINIKAGTSNVITLSPGYGIKKFVIIAEDIAGNVTTIEFTLKAEWLENKIILPDVSLPLFSEESYTLDDGQWIVTKKTTSGTVKDTTVYNGDLPVYVNEDGDYTFTKVT